MEPPAAPQPLEAEFVLKWRVGMRSALLISNTALRFQSSIEVLDDSMGVRLDAKQVMMLGIWGGGRPKLHDGSYNHGPDAGERVHLFISGPDARQALAAMRELFTCGETVVSCPHLECFSSAILTDFDADLIWYSCSKLHYWSAPRLRDTVEFPDFPLRA